MTAPRRNRPEHQDASNGVRITNSEIYDILLEVRDLAITERIRLNGLVSQVNLMWGILAGELLLIVGGVVTLFFQ